MLIATLGGAPAGAEESSRPTWSPLAELVTRDVTETSMTVRWTDGATDNQAVTGYRVYVDGELVGTAGSTDRRLTVEGLTPGTTYALSVQAIDPWANISTDGPQAIETTDDFDELDVPSIRGTVYEDANRNGRRDDGERGINPNIYPYLTFSAYRTDGTLRLQRTWPDTDTAGRFSFDDLADGTWTVVVSLGGRMQTTPTGLQPQVVTITDGRGWSGVDFGLVEDLEFPTSGNATATGVVYADADRDGVRDPGEQPLSGIEVGCSHIVSGGPCHDAVVSDENGVFEFDHVVPGTIDVIPTLPDRHFTTGHRVAAVSRGEHVGGLDLGIVAGTATVTGSVFHDRDRDGVRDAGEPSLDGTRVCAIDRHFEAEQCMFTEDDGTYRLSGLPDGMIDLSVSPWAGWEQTTPTEVTSIVVGAHGTGTLDIGVDGPDGTVRGVVFHDEDRDGVHDDGEPVLPGAEVCLGTSALEWHPCAETDDQGRYRIRRLIAAPFEVRPYAPSGYVSTLDEESLAFDLGADEDRVLDLGYAAEVEAAPPSAPRALRAEPGDRSATLTWSAPEDDGGTPVLGYYVWQSADGEQWERVARADARDRTWTATGLTNGARAWFRVAAYNAEGPGEASEPVSAVPVAPPATQPPPVTQPPLTQPPVTWGVIEPPAKPGPAATKPSAPRKLKGIARGGTVALRWRAPADIGGAPVTDYVLQRRVQKRWVTVRDGISSKTKATMRTVGRGTQVWRVAAVTAAGQGAWSGRVSVRVRR